MVEGFPLLAVQAADLFCIGHQWRDGAPFRTCHNGAEKRLFVKHHLSTGGRYRRGQLPALQEEETPQPHTGEEAHHTDSDVVISHVTETAASKVR